MCIIKQGGRKVKLKIVVIYSGSFINCPPAISVVNSFVELGHNVIIISGNPEDEVYFDKTKVDVFVPREKLYETPGNAIKWMFRYFYSKRFMRETLDKVVDKESIVWLVSEKPIKYLGKRILNYKYILQCLELGQEYYYSSHLPFKINMRLYLKNAHAITQCEENRASIFQAWWRLENKPYVLPNKMNSGISVDKYAYIHDDKAREIIGNLKGRKIILYQGILNKDRPIEQYIRAVDRLGSEYAFVVMSNYPNIYDKIESCNYYYIPFVKPPFHLEVTSHAYIGVLAYVPYKNEYSPLNYIYCAPNKIWEYAKLSVPMIGNDIPGLKYPFEMNNCGVCSKTLQVNDIIDAIRLIEKSYKTYSENAKRLYDSVDICQLLENIVEKKVCRGKE